MTPSYNHSYLAYRIAKVLDQDEKYNLHIEMTLDISGTDYIPDIVLYKKERIDFLHDKVKADKPPLLLVEILSPKQAVNEITEKFEVYLQAGVQSCWLVIPPTKTIVLFQDIQQPRSYSSGRFTDPVVELEVAVEDIFS
ncbi:MAG: Uma2 family endonuclease [Candidatus Electrothrix sp. Rat3]|nr:Uma2 family endonuclease [Candidatus Electrothrix rattekaaiensis]